MKIALGIEYSGRDYFGWQRQEVSPTIQEKLESALSQIANEQITVVCAGRTDAGVHAIQQVVHFETTAKRQSHGWVSGANTLLPGDIAVTWARAVDDDFNARFSAEKRMYQYLILNRRARSAIMNGLVTWECRRLDIELMNNASRCLLGEHDFTSFRAAACQAKTPVRRVYTLDIVQQDEWIMMTICANAFLHRMVRNIVGVLMTIGHGKEKAGWMQEVLNAKDRTSGGVTAPADGLYLAAVQYPERFAIPLSPTLTEKFRAGNAD